MEYIIDTDVCIDFLNGRDFAVKLFEDILKNNNCYVSILTHFELLKGAQNKNQENTIQEFVNLMDVINLDGSIIKTGAEFYRNYRKKGIALSTVDCLIMATAKERNLKIITRNIKHYPEKELLSEFSLGLEK